MKKLIIDIDNTITIDNNENDYNKKIPNLEVISKIKEYKSMGFEIILFTARNMKTFNGNIGKINKFTSPILMNWLDIHNVPYDELIFGKPWCGHDGFYIDDRAIRPSEFVENDYDSIQEILKNEQK